MINITNDAIYRRTVNIAEKIPKNGAIKNRPETIEANERTNMLMCIPLPMSINLIPGEVG